MSSDIIFEPSTSAVAQITQLSEMTMDEIKSLWRQLYRKEPPTHIRSFLEKRLAYRLQEVEFRRAHQNLAEKNDRRINAIINTGKKPLRDRYPQPIPGTVLSRITKKKSTRSLSPMMVSSSLKAGFIKAFQLSQEKLLALDGQDHCSLA